MEKAYKVLIFIIALATVGGLAYKWQTRYALADRLRLVELRLDQKISQDRYIFVKQQYEEMRRQYNGDTSTMPPATRTLYWEYEKEIKQVEQGGR